MAKQNLPNSVTGGLNYVGEKQKYTLLYESNRTQTGQVSFTASPSGVVYNTVDYPLDATIYNKGEEGLLQLLKNILIDYLLTAEDVNKIDILNDSGDGDQYLADDGTYKTITTNIYTTTTSINDTYTATIDGITDYAEIIGLPIVVKFTVANTTGATFNINSLGDKNIVRGTGTTLLTGDIPINKLAILCYNGTSFELLSQGESVSYTNHNHAGVYQPVGTYITATGVSKISVQSSAPSSPTTGDLWIDTSI